MAVNPQLVEHFISNELGLTAGDLCRLYGVEQSALGAHLTSLGKSASEVSQRVLSDIDAVRVGYRQVQVSDEQIAQFRALLDSYPFHPPVSLIMWNGQIGWRLSTDDAQYVAFRAADIVGLSFEAGDLLRQRLNTLVIWQMETPPNFDDHFRARLTDVTFYLIELGSVL
ncbi:MAG: hypothetical protein RML95_05665 [Anaerolineae bacterium]|nr:hypothetical protein [Anaerolineae bacterium]MDW8298805.1 hypothetical protein [Anaerolineae bacterium]